MYQDSLVCRTNSTFSFRTIHMDISLWPTLQIGIGLSLFGLLPISSSLSHLAIFSSSTLSSCHASSQGWSGATQVSSMPAAPAPPSTVTHESSRWTFHLSYSPLHIRSILHGPQSCTTPGQKIIRLPNREAEADVVVASCSAK